MKRHSTSELESPRSQLASMWRVPASYVFGITSCDYDVVLGRTVYNVILTPDGQWHVEDSYPVDMDGPYAALVLGE